MKVWSGVILGSSQHEITVIIHKNDLFCLLQLLYRQKQEGNNVSDYIVPGTISEPTELNKSRVAIVTIPLYSACPIRQVPTGTVKFLVTIEAVNFDQFLF